MLSGTQSPYAVSELLFNSFKPLVVVIRELLFAEGHRGIEEHH